MTLRFQPMDVAFGDTLLHPRNLVLEVREQYASSRFYSCYTTCSEGGGIGSCGAQGLRTQEEWLEWIDQFADDMTGRQLREAKEAARASFVEPESWAGFRARYAATGYPWTRDQEGAS